MSREQFTKLLVGQVRNQVDALAPAVQKLGARAYNLLYEEVRIKVGSVVWDEVFLLVRHQLMES